MYGWDGDGLKLTVVGVERGADDSGGWRGGIRGGG